MGAVRVVSWNINSLRARLGRAQAFMARHDPDVLCLQETKVPDAEFPQLAFPGLHPTVHGQKTYNGVAILSKERPDEVRKGIPGDPVPEQTRAVAARFDDLWVLDLYVVNGQAPDSDKFAIKERWLGALRDWLTTEFDPKDPVLLVGDFNITPSDADVHDPARWAGKIHCTPEERGWLAELQAWGLTDLHKQAVPEPEHTWWDYRMGAFARGWSLRIDLALGTAPVADRLAAVTVDRDERKQGEHEEKPSDHAPLIVDLH